MRKIRKSMSKCVLWILILCISMVGISNNVYAINQGDVRSQLNSLIAQYEGTTWNRNFAGGTQCYAFAHYVFNSIFGRGNAQVGNGAVSSNSTCYKLNNVASDIEVIGTLGPGYSLDNLKNLLKAAAPGDYVQVKRNSSGGPHSMIVVDVDSDSISIFDANSDGEGTVKHYSQSFSTFQSKNAGVSLYRHVSYEAIAPPTNPQISKSQHWYDLTDTIEITAYADGATSYYMSMFKDGERIKGQNVSGGKFTMLASDYGTGEYSAYFSCGNNKGSIDTEWITFSVVGGAGYSDIWTSKPIYNLDDEVAISVSTVVAKGQVIGIDKIGSGRIITEESDSTYTIQASQLGVGQYSAYFSVYNGSGSVDTEAVEFSIMEPSNLGEQFYAQIKNPSTNMYVSNVDGNVEGKELDCTGSEIWRFERQSDGTYKIISSVDEKAMDVTDYGNAGNGTNIQMNTSWDTTAQKFYIYEAYGAYYINPVCCYMFLDMEQEEPYNLVAWHGSADWNAQEYEIIKVDSNDVGVHKYVSEVIKEATCVEEGERKYTCSVCQNSYTERIGKLEHQYSDEWVIDVEATYTSEGSKSHHCVYCNAKTAVTVIPKLEQDEDVEIGFLSVSDVQGQIGETVAVPIKIERNPGIIAIQCDLQYDSSKVKLVSVEDSAMLEGAVLSEDYTKNPYVLSFSNELSETDILATGTLVTAYFEILPEFTEGTTEINLVFDEAYDKDLNEVEFEDCSGKIEIKKYVSGDVNGDGQVKLNDAILLRRYVAGWDVTIDLLAADVNRDGQVKLNDAILLRRYVAGWNVTLK